MKRVIETGDLVDESFNFFTQIIRRRLDRLPAICPGQFSTCGQQVWVGKGVCCRALWQLPPKSLLEDGSFASGPERDQSEPLPYQIEGKPHQNSHP
jgi:hypothetical protein